MCDVNTLRQLASSLGALSPRRPTFILKEGSIDGTRNPMTIHVVLQARISLHSQPASQVFHHYWKTGITSLNPQDVSAATLANPTFVYSLTGEGFALHYGTIPIAPFHLAPAFLDSKEDTPTVAELVGCPKSEFSGLIKCFRGFVLGKSGKLAIRLFAGDTFFLKDLLYHVGTGKYTRPSPWNTTLLVLDLDGEITTIVMLPQRSIYHRDFEHYGPP